MEMNEQTCFIATRRLAVLPCGRERERRSASLPLRLRHSIYRICHLLRATRVLIHSINKSALELFKMQLDMVKYECFHLIVAMCLKHYTHFHYVNLYVECIFVVIKRCKRRFGMRIILLY